MTFRDKLKALMWDRKQSVVARRVGVHPITYASYIKHGAVPSAEILFKISRVLGVSADWLLDDSAGWPPVRVEPSEPPVSDHASIEHTTSAA